MVTALDTRKGRYTLFNPDVCTPSLSIKRERVEFSLHQFPWLLRAFQEPACAVSQEVETFKETELAATITIN